LYDCMWNWCGNITKRFGCALGVISFHVCHIGSIDASDSSEA